MGPSGEITLHPPPNADYTPTSKISSSSSSSSSSNITTGGSLTYAGREGGKVLMLEAEGNQVRGWVDFEDYILPCAPQA